MSNIYYDPEDFGLTVVGSFDWADVDYEFDMCVVWKNKRGQYFVANDSGCSCPTPFEDITSVDDLDGPHTAVGLRARLEWFVEERPRGGYGYYSKSELKKSVSRIMENL